MNHTNLTPSSHEPYTLNKCKSSLHGMNDGLMLSIAMATNDIIPPNTKLHKILFSKGPYLPNMDVFLAYSHTHS